MNSITEKFWYTSEDSKNMRLLVSTLSEHPSAWTVTKCENVQPFGIQKLTIYSGFFNEHTDYVNMETGEMYADYFDSEIAPTDPSTPTPTPSTLSANLSSTSSTIKIGGSYRTINLSILNENNEDVTTDYGDATYTWSCSVDGTDLTDKITWRETSKTLMKFKFPNDSAYLGKILDVKCMVFDDHAGYIHSNTLHFEIAE